MLSETYHFAVFHKSLEGVYGFDSGDGLVFPDLKSVPNRSHAVIPGSEAAGAPVTGLENTTKAAATAAVTGLADSGLFHGQSRAFFQSILTLAEAADGISPL